MASRQWQDIPKVPRFTIRRASMYDLKTKKPVRYFSANTKIDLVQKCVTEDGTFYRTGAAAEKDLDLAFEASAFGLPDEQVSVVHSSSSLRTQTSAKKAPAPKTERVGEPTKQTVQQKATVEVAPVEKPVEKPAKKATKKTMPTAKKTTKAPGKVKRWLKKLFR